MHDVLKKLFDKVIFYEASLVLTDLTICERDINIVPTIYLDTYFAQYKDGRAMTDMTSIPIPEQSGAG